MNFTNRNTPLPRASLFCAAGLAGFTLFCGPGAHRIYIERKIPLPRATSAKTKIAPEKDAVVRDRFYLLETSGRHAPANSRAIGRALAGDWTGAETRWTGLLADGNDCRVAINIALARYLEGRGHDAFARARAALNDCPDDEDIRWNFRALARPTNGPRPVYRVIP